MFLTKINIIFRLFYLLSLIAVSFINVPVLYFYILFFAAHVEVLLLILPKIYAKTFSRTQIFFVFFILFVLFARSKIFKFSEIITYHINTIEHILFAIVICILLYFYCNFLILKRNKNTILFIVLIFNAIGIINEIFQNYVQEKPCFKFEEPTIKDIIVNFLGSIIFIVLLKLILVRNSFLNSLKK